MIKTPEYNLSQKRPFDVLNIAGHMGDNSDPYVFLFGSYGEEEEINYSRLKPGYSFYERSIIYERGIWSAVSCSSGYSSKDRRYQAYGAIMQTLPLDQNMEHNTEIQVRDEVPRYLCNQHMPLLVLAIVPRNKAKQALHSLALIRASEFLEHGEIWAHVGGNCDKGGHYHNDRRLDIKKVRDFISEQEYTNRADLRQTGYDKISKMRIEF